MDTTTVQPESIRITAAGSTPRFTMHAYSGGFARVKEFAGQRLVVDLDSATFASDTLPILLAHDPSKPIGRTDTQSIEPTRIKATGTLNGSADAIDVVTMHRSGRSWKPSIGAEGFRIEQVADGDERTINGRVFVGPFLHATGATITEISFVDVAGDIDAQLSLAAGNPMPKPVDETTRNKIDSMAQPPAAGWIDDEKILELKFGARYGEISFEEYTDAIQTELRASADQNDRQHRLAAMRDDLQQRNGGATGHRFEGRTNPVTPGQVIECGLLLKCGKDSLAEKHFDSQTLDAADQFRNMHLTEIGRRLIEMSGAKAPTDPAAITAQTLQMHSATSTVSLPQLMSDAMNKMFQDAFRESRATWRAICSQKTTSNFHENTELRPYDIGELEQLPADGEIPHGSVGEIGYTWTAETYAKMFVATRKMLINDNIGFLSDVPAGFARAAHRLILKLVFAELMANTGNFFSAPNGNLIDTELSVQGLTAATTAMRKQTDPEGGPIDIEPATLVVPPELEDQAKQILNSTELSREATADNAPRGNPHLSRLSLEVEPRLSNDMYPNYSATGWYIFAAPEESPMIAGFLGGSVPNIETLSMADFPNRLAAGWRVYSDVGVTLGEYRAAVFSSGTVAPSTAAAVGKKK